MDKNKQEHFIKNIEIKNFKCFEDFKAEGFGRVNLIGGKNNVGKTAFMEACRTNVYATNLGHFIVALARNKNTRETLNYYKEYTEGSQITFLDRFVINPLKTIESFNINSNINNIQFTPINEDGIVTYKCNINSKESIFIPKKDSLAPKGNQNITLISAYGLSYSEIIRLYAILQKIDQEVFLNSSLSIVDASITNFKIIKDTPYCKVYDKYIELTELGAGIQQFISIILSLFQSKNGYCFIDEIGYGIHYTNLDKLWEIILTISKEQNVQVFATTHSKECIESYARVAKKFNDEEIGFIELGRNKYDKLDSVVMDSEMFQRFVKLGNEVRGW